MRRCRPHAARRHRAGRPRPGPGGLALDAGPANGTPFSDTPSGTLSGGATQAADDAVRNPAGTNGGTPNLSR